MFRLFVPSKKTPSSDEKKEGRLFWIFDGPQIPGKKVTKFIAIIFLQPTNILSYYYYNVLLYTKLQLFQSKEFSARKRTRTFPQSLYYIYTTISYY